MYYQPCLVTVDRATATKPRGIVCGALVNLTRGPQATGVSSGLYVTIITVPETVLGIHQDKVCAWVA